MAGVLYIVATPIGNLEDITYRAVRILKEVDRIACEDTHHTGALLNHFGIQKPLISYHEHNERERAAELVLRLKAGETAALVSDAGTPLISDPGYRLVAAAIEAGVAVVPIPGPSAALAALSASGLATDSFYFGGFLPPKSQQRLKTLAACRSLETTLIFYETPHRVIEALADVQTALGSRPVVLSRELTKLHEEFLRGTPEAIRNNLTARPSIKGEFTLLIGKAEGAVEESTLTLPESVAEHMRHGLARMDAIKAAAKERGLSKREAYAELEQEIERPDN